MHKIMSIGKKKQVLIEDDWGVTGNIDFSNCKITGIDVSFNMNGEQTITLDMINIPTNKTKVEEKKIVKKIKKARKAGRVLDLT